MSTERRRTPDQSKADDPRRAKDFLSALQNKQSILVLMHDNPDPDAIAAAMAARALIESKLGKKAVLGFGGIIGRAENKAMVDELGVEMTPSAQIDFSSFDAVVLVDTQPGAGNHWLPPGVSPVAVIDHHLPYQEATGRAPFADVRAEYGATSTLLLGYLRQLSVPVDRRLATALFYGIKVDTQDLGRHCTEADVEAYRYLLPLVDTRLMPRIEYPRLPREYFETFHAALSRACTYGNVILSALDDVENPNSVAEVADMLLRLEGAEWSACLGFYQDYLYVSVRSADVEANAYEVIRKAMGSLGPRGGHGMLAGGRIEVAKQSAPERAKLRDRIARNLLQALGTESQRCTPLLRDNQAYASGTIG